MYFMIQLHYLDLLPFQRFSTNNFRIGRHIHQAVSMPIRI